MNPSAPLRCVPIYHRIDVDLFSLPARLPAGSEYGGGGTMSSPPTFSSQLRRDAKHVVTTISVRWERQRLARLEVAEPRADREDVHSPRCIVDVVLTADAMAHCGEQVGEGCS